MVYGVIWLITAPLRLLSDVTTPAVIANFISNINTNISTGYSWLPLTVIAVFATWGVFLTVEISIFLYKGLMWVLKKIPGIS